MEPKNPTLPEKDALDPGLLCLAGILGVAAVTAHLIARRMRQEDRSTGTAFDRDVPNYAWLR
jgi:uncharacterized OsmC-like protein